MFCDYCNSSGHIKEKCFCLHGYLDWHKLYGKWKPRKNAQSTASCTLKTAAQISTSVSDCHCDTSTKTTVPMPFTDAQCQQLSKMIHDSIRQTANWNLSSSGSQMTGINSSSHYSCSVVTVHSVLSSDNSQSYT